MAVAYLEKFGVQHSLGHQPVGSGEREECGTQGIHLAGKGAGGPGSTRESREEEEEEEAGFVVAGGSPAPTTTAASVADLAGFGASLRSPGFDPSPSRCSCSVPRFHVSS